MIEFCRLTDLNEFLIRFDSCESAGRMIPSDLRLFLSNAVTAPIFLVELVFSTPLFLSSFGEVIHWNGQTWQKQGVKVSIKAGKSGSLQGSLVIPDPEKAIGAICLGEKARGKVCRIYVYDLNADSGVLYFEGRMDAVALGLSVKIDISNDGFNTQFIPNGRITRDIFSPLMAIGTEIS